MTTRRTVLVVEDDGAMRDMLACLLDSLGYEPSAVADADTALFALRARAFDAVVSDLHMPQRDGFALARALRWV
ncbi:MAG: response regulator, partial [Steroidobacteraceae bacterium]